MIRISIKIIDFETLNFVTAFDENEKKRMDQKLEISEKCPHEFFPGTRDFRYRKLESCGHIIPCIGTCVSNSGMCPHNVMGFVPERVDTF